jgi:hypothetical protein
MALHRLNHWIPIGQLMRSCKKREIKKETSYQFTDVNELFELTQRVRGSGVFYGYHYNHSHCPYEGQYEYQLDPDVLHKTASPQNKSRS